jgi:hypothetical protein
MLGAHVGARHLVGELAALPQLAEVRAQRRQAYAMRLVDVALGVELVLAPVLRPGSRGCRRLRGDGLRLVVR